ncbi:MAG: 2-amino-4-hydroxy-6-hydroxymethyldihydropteridine diphosphokinase [Flavisolibacter sp.]
MNQAYLLIGGNMGERITELRTAKEAIACQCGQISKQSGIYETAAWGMEDQAAFLNQALELETHLSPTALLSTLLDIEESMGRRRGEKYGPRLIDIDILLFNDERIDLPGLKIPHPQMAFRRFVLEPLQEIAGQKIHPVLQKSISQLLSACRDPLMVNKIS